MKSNSTEEPPYQGGFAKVLTALGKYWGSHVLSEGSSLSPGCLNIPKGYSVDHFSEGLWEYKLLSGKFMGWYVSRMPLKVHKWTFCFPDYKTQYQVMGQILFILFVFVH